MVAWADLAALAQLATGLCFVVAAVAKARDMSTFQDQLAEMATALPVPALLAVLVVAVEVVLGLCFVTGLAILVAAPVALLVVVVFGTGSVVLANRSPNRRQCLCFGINGVDTASAAGVVRLGLLAGGIMATALISPIDGFRIPGLAELVSAAVVVLLGASVLQFVDLAVYR